MATKSKGFKMPHVFALMMMLTVLATILTWILPAGIYDIDPQTKRVIANSYHTIARNPQGIWDVFNAVTKGTIQSAAMMTTIFFIGGALKVLEDTGTIHAGVGRFVSLLKGREVWSIAIIMALMSITGATGTIGNSVIALVPLGVMLSKSLGYDAVVGAAMMYLGVYSGFNVGWGNMFTIGIANEVAGLPILSGFYLRVMLHILNTGLTILFVLLYIRRIKKDPTKSLVYDPDAPADKEYDVSTDLKETISPRQKACLVIVAVGFAFIIVGSLRWGWGISHSATVFLIVGLLCGFVGGLGLNGTFTTFVKGMGNLVFAAFVVAFARAISVVLTDGKIIHTVVYYLSIPIGKVSSVIGANVMLFANVIINFFIPSGSGQAVTVMPIMAPVADLTGITRQVAVQAFQFGDGFTNCVIPTSGVLMGVLGVAGISYEKYVRWYMPFLVFQIILGCCVVTMMQLFGW